jgi:hypothetical protein
MANEQPQPTFLVRFVGDDIAPERIPLRAVSDTLSAVQDIASARDPFEMPHVPPEKAIGLVDVNRGSAVYSCVSRAPDEARRNLSRVAALLSRNGEADYESDLLIASLNPLAALSSVARSIKCRIEIELLDWPQQDSSFAIGEGDFKRLSKNLLLKGDTTVVGTIERAGGVTGMRCLLRVPGRRRVLYCDVQTRSLVRRLGQHLYENIAATGKAVWIHHSWRIYKFTIQDFSQPRLGDGEKALEELRKAGLNAWDNIADPAAFIRETRQ